MQFSLKSMQSIRCCFTAVVFLAIAPVANAGSAESAYIQQAAANPASKSPVFAPTAVGQSTHFARSNAQVSLPPPPEQTVPHGATASNFAQTTEIGNFNSVLQIQTGKNDLSSV